MAFGLTLYNTISIHALREEGDTSPTMTRLICCRFLSTPSARRATTEWYKAKGGKEFLSTPSARRATVLGKRQVVVHRISIHALREEGDP